MSDIFDKSPPPDVANRIPAQAHADSKKQQQVLALLAQTGQALRELLALLPPPVHRLAIEMVAAGATCRHSPSPDQVIDTARMILLHAQWHREQAAPVLRLACTANGAQS